MKKYALCSVAILLLVLVIFKISGRSTRRIGGDVSRDVPTKSRIGVSTDSSVDEGLSINADDVLSLSIGGERLSLISKLSKELAFDDVQKCIEFAEKLTNPREKSTAYSKIVWALLEGDQGQVEKAFLLLNDFNKGDMRDFIIVANLERYLEADFGRTINLVSSLSNVGSIAAAARSIANSSGGHSLAESLDKLEYGLFRKYFKNEYIGSLALQDASVALGWMVKNIEPDDDPRSIGLIAQGFLFSSPGDGLDQISRVKDSKLRKQLSNELARTWARNDPEAAVSWYQQQITSSNDVPSREISRQILGNWIQWDNEAPFDVIDTMENFEGRSQVITDAVKTLSIFDPASAVDRLSSYPNISEGLRLEAISQISENWMERNSFEAGSWIASLPLGSERDVGIEIVVNEIVENDGDQQLAMDWVMKLSDLELKKKYQNLLAKEN